MTDLDQLNAEDQTYSWREKRFIQWIKPPDPTLNINKRKLKKLIYNVLSHGGRVLDLGSGGRTLAMGVINFDLRVYENVHIVGKAAALPFRDRTFDLVVITAVLEHVPDPYQVVDEIYRCLVFDGQVYAEIPFLQGYHADPHDYQRYTLRGIITLFDRFRKEEAGVCVGPISVLTWYLRKLPTIFFTNVNLVKAIEFITGWLFFVVKYLDFFLAKPKNAHILASGLYYIGSKPSTTNR